MLDAFIQLQTFSMHALEVLTVPAPCHEHIDLDQNEWAFDWYGTGQAKIFSYIQFFIFNKAPASK